jgi:hypothetical protein
MAKRRHGGLALAVVLAAIVSACGNSGHERVYVPVLTHRSSYLRIEPQRLIVAGDGSQVLTHVDYRNYGAASVEATGTLLVDDCVNSCAGGTFHPVAATLRFGGVVPCHKKRVYTRLVMDAPRAPRFNHLRHQMIALDDLAALCEPGERLHRGGSGSSERR